MQASERGRIPSYPCAGKYIEYGHDKALGQRKGGSPSQLVFRNARLWDEERTKFGKWIGKLFIRCLVTKIQNLQGPKWTDFLLLRARKKHIFSATKGPPDEWCSTRCKILPLQLASFSFTKMQASERGRIPSYPCAGRYIEYGHDKSLRQRKGGVPLSTRIQECTIVGWGKNQIREVDREVVHKMFGDKNQKFAGSQMDRFLFTLCPKKTHFFCHKGSPRRMVFYPLQDLAFATGLILLYKDASIRKRKDSFIPLRGEIHRIWPW